MGVVCEGNKKTEPDLISEERPVKMVTKAKTDFDSITGKVVTRRIVGVQNRVVYIDRVRGEGFIITYIPKSDEAPHRVEEETTGSRRYYRRHGNGSYEMEHYELEELFSGRTQPKIYFVIKAFPKKTVDSRVEEYALAFGLKNVGRTIARFPFIEITESNLPLSGFGIDGNRNTGMPRIIGTRNKYQGGADHVIHIYDTLWVDQFIFKPVDSIGMITVKIACDGFGIKTMNRSVNLKYLAQTLKTYRFEYESDKLEEE